VRRSASPESPGDTWTRRGHASAGTEHGPRFCRPAGIWPVKVVSVPRDPVLPIHMLGEPRPHGFLRIVEVGHSAIVENTRIHELAGVSGQHVEPDNVHANTR